jgi:hypothetical protein
MLIALRSLQARLAWGLDSVWEACGDRGVRGLLTHHLMTPLSMPPRSWSTSDAFCEQWIREAWQPPFSFIDDWWPGLIVGKAITPSAGLVGASLSQPGQGRKDTRTERA